MKKNYLKIRFKLWLKSPHFKRFQTIMIVISVIALINVLQGNPIALIAIPLTMLLFAGLTLFPFMFVQRNDNSFDRTLDIKMEKIKKKDYEDYLKSPEHKRKIRNDKLNRILK